MKTSKKRGRKPGFKMSEENKWNLSIKMTDPKVTARRGKILDYLMDNGHNLQKMIRSGVYQDMSVILGINERKIKDDVKIIRIQCGVTDGAKGQARVIKPTLTELHRYLMKYNLYRDSLLETPICKKIVEVMREETLFPRGGVGLLFGTATPQCLLRKNPTRIIDDNLDVGKIMVETTDVPLRVVVGNAKDEDKAGQKVILWRSYMVSNAIVKADVVDRVSFEYTIKDLVNKYGHTLVKVVLLTSGVWKHNRQSQKTHGDLDLRFEMAAVKLTRKYDNLHILAMCKNNSFGFDLRYLHNSRNEVIYKNGMKEV